MLNIGTLNKCDTCVDHMSFSCVIDYLDTQAILKKQPLAFN